MILHISATLTWAPHHEVTPGTVHIDGQLSDGRQLDVCAESDRDLAPADRSAAREAWLHSGVHIIDADIAGAPTVVIPGSSLPANLVTEAVRRYHYVTARVAA